MCFHVRNNCKGCGPWRHWWISLNSWYHSADPNSENVAVMTGVSEFLGFLAIKIIPGHARLEHPPRRSYRGLKNDDPLLRESSSSDEGRSDDTARSVHATEHEADLLSGN